MKEAKKAEYRITYDLPKYEGETKLPQCEEERGIKIGTPPIHEHYNEKTDQAELCGKVFCPKGYVGVSPAEQIVDWEDSEKPEWGGWKIVDKLDAD